MADGTEEESVNQRFTVVLTLVWRQPLVYSTPLIPTSLLPVRWGSNRCGAAFDVADATNLTIMQLLLARELIIGLSEIVE